MRTKLVLYAALAALLAACENKQITEVTTDGQVGIIGSTGSTGQPPSSNGIDYTPRGGSGRVGTTAPLTAICGTAICPAQQPFWTSDHPELIAVRGSTQGSRRGCTYHSADPQGDRRACPRGAKYRTR